MKKILVPTDFSKCAGNALIFALEIARRTDAEVTVLNVSRPYEGIDNNIYNALWIDDYLDKKRLALSVWIKKYRRNPLFENLTILAETRTGFAADEVAHIAENGHFDLIVMGTTGATGLKEIFLGSVASSIIARTKLPVLAVPKTGQFHKLATVVFATDFRVKMSARSIRTLRQLLDIENAPLDVVHVYEKESAHPTTKQEAELREKLVGIDLSFHYLRDANVPRAVGHFCQSIGAHVLCTVSHEHGLIHRLFMDSVSRRFAHHAEVPLLALHD